MMFQKIESPGGKEKIVHKASHMGYMKNAAYQK